MFETLAKATIELIDTSAEDSAKGLPRSFEVQFNPTELTLNKGVQLAEIAIPGLDSSLQQFVRGQSEQITLELFFDTSLPESSIGASLSLPGAKPIDVNTKLQPFYMLAKVSSKLHSPPRIQFTWGKFSFRALVESVRRTYTHFSPTGVPVRATASVGMRECRSLDQQLKDLNLQSPDHTRRYVVVGREPLSHIAAKEYGDPAVWRHIANHKPNAAACRRPQSIPPGTVLELPPLTLEARGGRSRQ